MADITWTWQLVDETKVRYVRTQGGVRRYDQPIGSPIVPEGGARSALKLKPGRALKGETRTPKAAADLKPGDEVVTHGSGVGRAVRASGPSAGEVRRVVSVEDGETQYGPSGKGKTVVRFEDGSFSTPSSGKWDTVSKPTGETKPDSKLTTPAVRVQTTDMNTDAAPKVTRQSNGSYAVSVGGEKIGTVTKRKFRGVGHQWYAYVGQEKIGAHGTRQGAVALLTDRTK